MTTKQEFASFTEMISSSDTPVLVDFYASWCGLCQLMAKILEQVKGEMKQQVRIVKIDTEKYPALASQNQIYALPTLILFKQGQPVDRIEGVLQPNQLVQRIKAAL